jgi:hypothetical protein
VALAISEPSGIASRARGEKAILSASFGGTPRALSRWKARTDGKLEQMLRQSIMKIVGGGSAEVQRNLIALRGLNLPR